MPTGARLPLRKGFSTGQVGVVDSGTIGQCGALSLFFGALNCCRGKSSPAAPECNLALSPLSLRRNGVHWRWGGPACQGRLDFLHSLLADPLDAQDTCHSPRPPVGYWRGSDYQGRLEFLPSLSVAPRKARDTWRSPCSPFGYWEVPTQGGRLGFMHSSLTTQPEARDARRFT